MPWATGGSNAASPGSICPSIDGNQDRAPKLCETFLKLRIHDRIDEHSLGAKKIGPASNIHVL
jgi:hypothetical protein